MGEQHPIELANSEGAQGWLDLGRKRPRRRPAPAGSRIHQQAVLRRFHQGRAPLPHVEDTVRRKAPEGKPGAGQSKAITPNRTKTHSRRTRSERHEGQEHGKDQGKPPSPARGAGPSQGVVLGMRGASEPHPPESGARQRRGRSLGAPERGAQSPGAKGPRGAAPGIGSTRPRRASSQEVCKEGSHGQRQTPLEDQQTPEGEPCRPEQHQRQRRRAPPRGRGASGAVRPITRAANARPRPGPLPGQAPGS